MTLKFNKILFMTAVITMIVSQVQGQECCEETCGKAYWNSKYVAVAAAALPIGALVIATIAIGATKGHHYHSVNISQASNVHSTSSVSTPSVSTSSGS